MRIHRTLCRNCGEEMDKVIVHDYRFACPHCNKTLDNDTVKKRAIFEDTIK